MANEKRLDLIDRKELAEKIYAIHYYIHGMRNGKTILKEFAEKYQNDVLRTICKAPTVDAVEVVHGHWYKAPHHPYRCSCCGEMALLDMYGESHVRSNYCPNCGAKMDGGNEDG